jgi:Lipocalin-like domain
MNIVGTWKLRSFTTKYLDNGQIVEPFGAHPTGYLSYGPDCRMYAIIVHEDRKSPAGAVPTEAEKAALFDGGAAYAGTYAVDADVVRHYVDISWNQAWTGTTQVRHFKIVGDTLHVSSVPDKNLLDGRLSSSIAVWTRVERRR